jgi:hypothetical protein
VKQDGPRSSDPDPVTTPRADFNPDRHRAQTDRELLLGGFGLLLVVGGALVALFLGGGAALVAVGILAGAGVLVGLLYLIIQALERLAQ